MAYLIDFRRKVLEIKELDGLRFEETALSANQAKRLEPCLTRNKRTTKITPDRLIRDVEQHHDAYQHHEVVSQTG